MSAYLASLARLVEDVKGDAAAAKRASHLHDGGLSARLHLDAMVEQLESNARVVRADVDALIDGGEY